MAVRGRKKIIIKKNTKTINGSYTPSSNIDKIHFFEFGTISQNVSVF